MRLSQPIWPRFLPTQFVLSLATLGPIGRLPAPGTWGSIAGWLYFVVVFLRFSDAPTGLFVATLLLSLVGGYLAIAFCGEAEFRMGVNDPGPVILDEFVAVPLCFLGWPRLVGALPPTLHIGTIDLGPLLVSVTGLCLFRLFDIAKPFGISRLQRLPAGWGIVIDDTAAALASCAVLHLALGSWTLLR